MCSIAKSAVSAFRPMSRKVYIEESSIRDTLIRGRVLAPLLDGMRFNEP